jgi:GntR family histidine utilization transcriptional repressor
VVDGRHIARDAIEARYRKALTTVLGQRDVRHERAATLHRRIYAELEGRILSGGWAPGSRIPFEHELTAHYGCSRMTVNKAISELAGRGLVTRRAAPGPSSPRRAPTPPSWPSPTWAPRSPSVARPTASACWSGASVRPATGDERELAGEGGLLELECLHVADDAPFALEHRLIALAAAPEAATCRFLVTTPPGVWLLDTAPWTEAEHRISAVAASASEARLLGLKSGTACLRLERRTWRDGQGVTRVWQTFPGDRYDLVARFSPARGDRP